MLRLLMMLMSFKFGVTNNRKALWVGCSAVYSSGCCMAKMKYNAPTTLWQSYSHSHQQSQNQKRLVSLIKKQDFDLKRLWYVKDVLRFLLNVNYFSKYLDALNKTIRNNEEVIEILSYFIDRYFVFALSKYNISRLFIYVLQLAYLQFFVY